MDALQAEYDQARQRAEQALQRTVVQNIVSAYERALNDPKFLAPSYLHAAIEVARHELKQPA